MANTEADQLQSLATVTGTEDEVVVNTDETLLGSIQERLKAIREPGTIYRVREDIRKEDPRAYSPSLVAIGPYHNDKARVLPLEYLKSKFLGDLISRHPSNGVEKYITTLSDPCFLAKASKGYSEPVDITDGGNSFIEMLLFDGCFIIEFLLKVDVDKMTDEVGNIYEITRDLLLVENQIPFFVLEALFNSTTIEGLPYDEESASITLKKLVFRFLRYDVDSFESSDTIPAVVHHLLHQFHSAIMVPNKRSQRSDLRLKEIPTATELHNHGIKFRIKETCTHILDITFNNGVMEIPWMRINVKAMCNLRNLMAFELSYPAAGNYIISYIDFMNNLIDTAGDVALLDRSGVMGRNLGGHEEMARFFNSIGKGALLDYNKHYLKEVLVDVNEYCSHKKHRLLASMMNDYFYSPWSTMSVIAAVILLLLTLAQTIFAFLAYFHRS